MPDGLYERDALLWSEQQADLLRRLAEGERLNAAVERPYRLADLLAPDADLSALVWRLARGEGR